MEAADAPPPPEPAPAVVANGASNTDRPLPQEIAEPAPAVVANGASNAEARPQPQEIAAVAQAGALAAVHSLSSLAGGALASLAGAPAEPVPVEEPGPAARPLPVLSHSSLENLLSDKILTLLNRATEDVAAAPPQDCLQSLSHIPAKQADGALDWMRRRIFMTDSLVVRHKTLVTMKVMCENSPAVLAALKNSETAILDIEGMRHMDVPAGSDPSLARPVELVRDAAEAIVAMTRDKEDMLTKTKARGVQVHRKGRGLLASGLNSPRSPLRLAQASGGGDPSFASNSDESGSPASRGRSAESNSPGSPAGSPGGSARGSASGSGSPAMGGGRRSASGSPSGCTSMSPTRISMSPKGLNRAAVMTAGSAAGTAATKIGMMSGKKAMTIGKDSATFTKAAVEEVRQDGIKAKAELKEEKVEQEMDVAPVDVDAVLAFTDEELEEKLSSKTLTLLNRCTADEPKPPPQDALRGLSETVVRQSSEVRAVMVEWLRRRALTQGKVLVTHKTLVTLQVLLENARPAVKPKLAENELILADIEALMLFDQVDPVMGSKPAEMIRDAAETLIATIQQPEQSELEEKVLQAKAGAGKLGRFSMRKSKAGLSKGLEKGNQLRAYTAAIDSVGALSSIGINFGSPRAAEAAGGAMAIPEQPELPLGWEMRESAQYAGSLFYTNGTETTWERPAPTQPEPPVEHASAAATEPVAVGLTASSQSDGELFSSAVSNGESPQPEMIESVVEPGPEVQPSAEEGTPPL